MCWPLTKQWRPHSDDKGDREAVGTGRAGGREAEECPRKTTRLLAARGHDRRSPPVESQGDGRMRTGTGPETTSRSRSSSARHDRGDSTDVAGRYCAHRTRNLYLLVTREDGQMVGFDAVLRVMRLSASRRRCAWLDGC